MNIELTAEQNDLVWRAIEAGRIARPEQAVAEAMAFWVEAERQRGELLASLDQAEAEFERGEYHDRDGGRRSRARGEYHGSLPNRTCRQGSCAGLMVYRLSRQARRDLDDIARHISRAGRGDGERVVTAVIRSLRMLSDNPLAGRSRRDDLVAIDAASLLSSTSSSIVWSGRTR